MPCCPACFPGYSQTFSNASQRDVVRCATDRIVVFHCDVRHIGTIRCLPWLWARWLVAPPTLMPSWKLEPQYLELSGAGASK